MSLYTYQLPFLSSVREGLIVQWGEGLGDIAPLPGFSKESFAEAKEEALRLLSHIPEATPTLPSVRFGFACAQRAMLGRLEVSVAALETLRKGFGTLKLKLGALPLEEALRKIRAVPKGVLLRLDFNRQWPLERLLALAKLLPENIDYLEEPTAAWGDLLRFSQETGLPIALDESIPEHPYGELPSLKALVVKPTILGFVPTPPPGVELVFSSAFESGVGVLHLAQLALELNPDRPHGLDSYTRLGRDVLRERPVIENGKLMWSGPFALERECLTQIA